MNEAEPSDTRRALTPRTYRVRDDADGEGDITSRSAQGAAEAWATCRALDNELEDGDELRVTVIGPEGLQSTFTVEIAVERNVRAFAREARR